MGRTLTSSLALAGGLLMVATSGCLEPSLNSLFAPEDSIVDARLLGTWTCGDSETWTVEQTQKTIRGQAYPAYRVAIKDSVAAGDVTAMLGHLDANQFITFSAAAAPSGLPRFVTRQYIVGNTFGQVWIENNRIRLNMLDAKWAADAKHTDIARLGDPQGGALVLTAQTPLLKVFARAHADDKEAFPETVVLVRPGQGGGKCYSDK